MIAGVALGWAWFAICTVAFGGRFLHFGAPVEKATEVAEALPRDAIEGSDVVQVALERPEHATTAARDSR